MRRLTGSVSKPPRERGSHHSHETRLAQRLQHRPRQTSFPLAFLAVLFHDRSDLFRSLDKRCVDLRLHRFPHWNLNASEYCHALCHFHHQGIVIALARHSTRRLSRRWKRNTTNVSVGSNCDLRYRLALRLEYDGEPTFSPEGRLALPRLASPDSSVERDGGIAQPRDQLFEVRSGDLGKRFQRVGQVNRSPRIRMSAAPSRMMVKSGSP